MNRSAYYEEMKELAHRVRSEYGLATPRVLRSDLRRIYRAKGIRVDLWPHRFKKLRGAYFRDELGATVMLVKGLPEDPIVFTMAHELKHHLVDQNLLVTCQDVDETSAPIEIGAEVFAAEFIYPEQEFLKALRAMGVGEGAYRPEHIVRLKRDTRTTLSYTGLAKRAEFYNLAPRGSLANVPWKKLEEQMYGEPLYRRLLRRRKQRTSR